MKQNFKLGILVVTFVTILINVFCLKIEAKNKENNKIGQMLFGKTIYIDAGHGGKDNGASVDSVLEDEINLKISEYLTEFLINSNCYVLSTRTGDYDLASIYDKNRKREDLKKRVNYINTSKPSIFISIHLNTYPSSSIKGGQTFYQNNEMSKNLANFIQNEMNELSTSKRKSKKGDYYILNNTSITGVLVECGFLSNSEERIKLNTDVYQREVALRIYKGIINYFNYS